MNSNLFKEIYGAGSVPDSMIAASVSEDDIGVLLRIHLISERFLEAFISAAINKGDLFAGPPNDKKRLQMNYGTKLSLASKLSLPDPTYHAFSSLNSARNRIAHQIESGTIDQKLIDAFELDAEKINGHTDLHLDKGKMLTRNEHGVTTIPK